MIPQLGLRLQNEIGVGFLCHQEAVVLERSSFRRADNHAVLRFPQPRIAIPSIEILSIEQRLEAVLGERPEAAQQQSQKQLFVHNLTSSQSLRN